MVEWNTCLLMMTFWVRNQIERQSLFCLFWSRVQNTNTFQGIIFYFLKLSYGSLCPLECDRECFLNLYQIALNEISIAIAIVPFLVHFKCNREGVIMSNDDLGIQFLPKFGGEFQTHAICWASVSIIVNGSHSFRELKYIMIR